jgi:hypothetical protein
MARFSGNIYKVMNEKEQENEIIKVVPMLQEMMAEEDWNKIREDYHNGLNNSIPFWKYLFEHVEVKYIK